MMTFIILKYQRSALYNVDDDAANACVARDLVPTKRLHDDMRSVTAVSNISDKGLVEVAAYLAPRWDSAKEEWAFNNTLSHLELSSAPRLTPP